MEFRYSMHIDLIYHVLAYMRVNNNSDCYSKLYIDRISKEKKSFHYNIENDMRDLGYYYNNNFNRLMYINFLPFVCSNYDEMKDLLFNFPNFTDEDKEFFLKPFIKALDKEKEFYNPYWDSVHNSSKEDRLNLEEWIKKEFNKYTSILDYVNKPMVIYLTYSITKNGRALMNNDSFLVFTPYSNSVSSYYRTFFQILHECTHQFTDTLLSNISMDDNTHTISEHLVMVADYYIVKSMDRKSISNYFDWINYNQGLKISTDEEFFDTFKLEKDIYLELINLLHNISNAIITD